MAEDESKPVGKDVLVLGRNDKGEMLLKDPGSEGLTVFRPLAEGAAGPPGSKVSILHLDQEKGPPHARLEDLTGDGSAGHKGPSRVSSRAFCEGYDQIRWGPTPKEIN